MKIEYFSMTIEPIEYSDGLRLETHLKTQGRTASCVQCISSDALESTPRNDIYPLFDHMIDRCKEELKRFLEKWEK